MTWSVACRELVEIIFSCDLRLSNIFKKRLHEYIAALHPDVLIDSYLSNADDEKTFYSSALLALEEEDRIKAFQVAIRYLSPLFPDALDKIEYFLEHLEREQANQEQTSYYKRLDKLNRYLKRVDGAINSRKYALAMGLANRCLMEYYRDFMKYTMKYEAIHTNNINQMAIYIYRYILKYFRSNNIPYSATRLLYITMVTNVLFVTMSTNSYIDRALATYARDNVNSIVRFLARYS